MKSVVRSCVVCRQPAAAEAVFRFAVERQTGEVVCDLLRARAGRGVHVHAAPRCLASGSAQKAVRGAFLRAQSERQHAGNVTVRRPLPELVAAEAAEIEARYPGAARRPQRVIAALKRAAAAGAVRQDRGGVEGTPESGGPKPKVRL